MAIVGRGIHARTRRAVARLVPGPARSRAIRRRVEASARRERRAGPADRTPLPAPAQSARYAVQATLRPRRSGVVLAVRARSRTAIPRFMPCSAWPATSWRRPGESCRAPAWGRFCSSASPRGISFVSGGAVWAAALAAVPGCLQPNLFGHGHYAAYDAVLTSLWVLSIIAFAQAAQPDEPPRHAGRLPMGLDTDLRSGSRLRGRNQADRLVPAIAVLAWAVLYRAGRAS